MKIMQLFFIVSDNIPKQPEFENQFRAQQG
jgi:hypothetical protein